MGLANTIRCLKTTGRYPKEGAANLDKWRLTCFSMSPHTAAPHVRIRARRSSAQGQNHAGSSLLRGPPLRTRSQRSSWWPNRARFFSGEELALSPQPAEFSEGSSKRFGAFHGGPVGDSVWSEAPFLRLQCCGGTRRGDAADHGRSPHSGSLPRQSYRHARAR
jgi:hypothetical protein